MQHVPPTPDGRQTWIDLLRGASVLLVILFHSLDFALASAGRGSPSVQGSTLLQAVDLFNGTMGPIRMELMFLLSGVFVGHGLRKGKTKYITGKIHNVLYPFVVWALINFALHTSGSVLIKGEPIAWRNLVDLLLGDGPPTWFLFDLFACFLIVPFIRQFPPLLVLPLLACGSLSLSGAELGRGADFLYYLAYFYSGDFIACSRWNPGTRWGHWGLLASGSCIVGIVMLANRTHFEHTWIGYLPLVLGSLPLIVRVSMLAVRTPLAAPLIYAGRNSIVFYLVHFTLFIALVHVLEKLTSDGPLIFAALLASGIALPALMSMARQRPSFAFIDLLFSMRTWAPARNGHALPSSATST
ncbi:Fucose 4-O-acetylase [Pseudoxanthomonas sp. GM95]|uniref:acyltransferase family protein n=1 Tax=Pseudoxanthomonas sp. GM95 TaxID=1881043 RepID=UPI0008B9757D|nr:acyltransferase [Pseudoxanthomonas sp. GM95]SEM20689.1 Fucose 4-O-acetylase [Pseudoxanthomonas sp. GM95]